MPKKRRILIADTTLRDGAQTIGAQFSVACKLKVASQLHRLGVDCIEVGTPIAAPQELEASKEISSMLKKEKVTLGAFARSREKDIELAWEGVGSHPKGMLNLLTSVSDIHIESKFKSSRSKILPIFCSMIEYGKKVGFKKILVYLEDGTRAEFSYIKELVSAFASAGANIISIPDTVGFVNSPSKYGEIYTRIKKEVKLPKGVLLSSHTHNDKGLAVANALEALNAGAGMVECTVNGLGERAGNASLGALLLNLYGTDHGKHASVSHPFTTGVNLEEYARTASLVGELGGLGINYNEPLVGPAVISTVAGIHQDGIIKNRKTYLCYDPEDFGIETDQRLITFSMQSGLKGIMKVLDDSGIQMKKEDAERVYKQVILLAQQKKPSHEDIRAIALDVLEAGEEVFQLKVCKAESGVMPCSADVVIERSDTEEKLSGTGYGDGPFAAFMDVVCPLLKIEAKILDYHDTVVGEGRDSQMQCFIRCTINGEEFNGRGVSTDIVQAGCRAFMKCINRYFNT